MRIVLALGLWLGASVAYAAEPPSCAPDVQLRSTQLDYQGKAGVWFDAEVARCLLEEVQTARELGGLLREYEHRDLLHVELLDLTLRQRDLAIEGADRARVGMESAIKLRGEAERQLEAPGRSRALWFAVGLGTGILVVAVSAYAVTAATR